jgi:membrane protease YdiL (CAAX protease family)
MRSRPSASPTLFFALVFALSIPFWVAGGRSGVLLLPGLPLSALAVICPALAAVLLRTREGEGTVAFLKEAVAVRGLASMWLAPTLLLMPGLFALSYLLMGALGRKLPPATLHPLPTLLLFGLFVVGGLAEELGWSGYATPALERRLGALPASLLLGVVWATWHFIPLHQANRSLIWVAWWTLGTVATRVLLVWIFDHTGGCVLAAALCHASLNLAWQLFPSHGSAYGPSVTSPLLAVAAAAVISIWRPRTPAGARAS